MRITILNGSPKGSRSITLYTVKFLAKHFPEHQWTIENVAQKLRYYEQHPEELHHIASSDLIIFAYPVYTFLAPSQLHRIIELIKQQGVDLRDKWCTQITTSKHVYDFTAHRFIDDNAADLGMKIIPGLSADMDDLLTPQGQQTALLFWQHTQLCITNNIQTPTATITQSPSLASPTITTPTAATSDKKSDKFDTVLVTCAPTPGSNLALMIEYFKTIYPHKLRIIDIAQYPFLGGCIGCLKCTTTEQCFYKDNFDTFLRSKIQNADACIYALNITDHSFGSIFKKYQDRHFCNGHRTKTMGKPLGFILSGQLSKEENLKTYINAMAQVGHNQLTFIASDEYNPTADLNALSITTNFALQNSYLQPQNFLGIGGHKIFRDLIYQMRGMMQADHKFYKEKGFYNDFPQKHWKQSLFIKLVGLMMKNKKLNSKVQQGMTLPYEKVLNSKP